MSYSLSRSSFFAVFGRQYKHPRSTIVYKITTFFYFCILRDIPNTHTHTRLLLFDQMLQNHSFLKRNKEKHNYSIHFNETSMRHFFRLWRVSFVSNDEKKILLPRVIFVNTCTLRDSQINRCFVRSISSVSTSSALTSFLSLRFQT